MAVGSEATAQRKTFYATVHVTRVEEWCVEAESADEARVLLDAGQGERCHSGERLHCEVVSVEEEQQARWTIRLESR